MNIIPIESLEENSKNSNQDHNTHRKSNQTQLLRNNSRKILKQYLLPTLFDPEHDQDQPDTSIHNYPSFSDAVDALYVLFPDIYKKRREIGPKEQSSLGSQTSVLPHKLPLKRRFADHKWRDYSKKDKRFIYGTNCIDRFKDIPTALIVKLYHSGVILGGHNDQIQTDNPLMISYSNPLIQELLEWIDRGLLHPDLMQVAISSQVPFYDGGIIVEMHDFRNISDASSYPLSNHISSNSNLSKHSYFARNSQAEIHRLFLRPNDSTLHADLIILLNEAYGENNWNDDQYLNMEQRLRDTFYTMPQSDTICLNPSPQITHLMNFFHYQNKQKRIKGPWTRAWTNRKSGQVAHKEDEKDADIESYQFGYIQKILDLRRNKLLLESEPFPGLDSKRHLFPTRRSINWDVPLQRIYRTVRMERENPLVAFSLHVLVGLDGLPEIILSIGEQSQYRKRMMIWMDHLAVNIDGIDPHSSNRTTTCFKLPRPQLIEPYIQSFKVLTSIQDTRVKCVADLTNPSAWNLFTHFKT